MTESRQKLVSVGTLLLSSIVVGLVITETTYQVRWPWAALVPAAPFAVASLVLAIPAACGKLRLLLGSAPVFQVLLLMLLLSVFVGSFFPSIEIRTAAEMQEKPVNAVNLARVILVGIVGLITVATVARNHNTVRPSLTGALPWMLLYAGIALFSSSYSTLPLVSAGKALEVAVDVSFFLLVARSLSAEQITDLWNLCLFCLGVMLLGVWVTAILVPSEGFQDAPGALFPQLQGACCPTLHPNSVGQFGAILAVIGFIRLIREGWRDGSAKILWAGISFFGLISLAAAQARTSVFALVAVAAALIYRSRKVGLAAISCMAVAPLLLGLRDILTEFLRRGQDEEGLLTISGRFYYWQAGWDFFRESMLLGHGFYTAHRVDLNKGYRVLDLSTVDNTFLEVLIGVGVIGAIPLLIAILVLLRRLLRCSITAPDTATLSNVSKEMLAVLIIVLFRSLTGPSFQEHTPSLLIVLICMAFVHTHWNRTAVISRLPGTQSS